MRIVITFPPRYTPERMGHQVNLLLDGLRVLRSQVYSEDGDLEILDLIAALHDARVEPDHENRM